MSGLNPQNLNQEQNNFHGFQDSFVIQPIPVLPQPSPNLQVFREPFNLQNCAQVFTFPQQGNIHWQPLNLSQDLATPTNLPATINNLGAICSATPEFIHPRNSNAPQWLMSPPVEEVYPPLNPPIPLNPVPLNPENFTMSNVTLNPSSNHDLTLKHQVVMDTPLNPLSNGVKLLTPDDFSLKKFKNSFAQTCGVDSLCLHNDVTVTSQTSVNDIMTSQIDLNLLGLNSTMTSQLSNTLNDDHVNVTSQNHNNTASMTPPHNDSIMTSSHRDSGISSPTLSPLKGSRELEKLFTLSRESLNLVEFEQKLKKLFVQELTLGSLLFALYFNPTSLLHEMLNRPVPPNEKEPSSFPIGVFWDIENCSVPCGKSASQIVLKIRNHFFQGHKEVEFMAVCDINKETRRVVQDLNNSQVNVVHVNANSKNAADEKLRQSIRRFAQTYKAPASIILITGDCDFMAEISDLRYRHKYFVVLIHPPNTRETLTSVANTSVKFEEFVQDIPISYPLKEINCESQLIISNLPRNVEPNLMLTQLNKLTRSFHSQVTKVTPPTAVIRFPNDDLARRAMRRLQGSEVMGSIIMVQRRSSDLSALSKHFTPRYNNRNQQYEESRPRNPNIGSNRHKGTHSKPTNKSNVQVTISNIDAQLGVKTIQQKIYQIISKISPILKLQIRPHNRFTVVCDVIVPSIERASCVLQQLHRTRIGSKRILLTITQNNNNMRNEVMSLLKETGEEGITFQQFQTIYSQSFQKKLSLKELYEMPDVVRIFEDKSNVYIFNTSCNRGTDPKVCLKHFPPNQRWHKRDGLLKIEIGLREFSAKLHALLHMHDGAVYMDGFEFCYEAEFGSFPYPINDQSGVYFHHQVSYVPGVQINEDKVIVWTQPSNDNYSDTASEASSSSRSKSSNLVSLSREIVNFLKCFPYCAVVCKDFKKYYASHFGRNLCVDVNETLSSIPHVAQIIGTGDHKMVTLTHRAQVKRFVLEITKILKTSPDRAILVAQLPDMYFKSFDRAWKLRDYGVSVLTDILDDIPEGNILVNGSGDNIVLSLPTRVRTPEEVENTETFSLEVVEILKLRPDHRISFTEFVPSYHRQYGRQCKLSKYGFNKLLDLFESLTTVIKVVELDGEKYLQLCESEQIKVLSSQVIALLRHHVSGVEDGEQPLGVPLSRLQSMFSRKYGFPLVPKYFDCSNIQQLVSKLSHAVKMTQDTNGEIIIQQTERKPLRLLTIQLLVLLLDSKLKKFDFESLHQYYIDRYNEDILPHNYGYLSLCDVIKKALSGIVKFTEVSTENVLSLKPIYKQAKKIRNILLQHEGLMTLGEFNQAYKQAYGEPLNPEKHGFRTNEGMLRALTLVLVVKGFGIKKTLLLRNHMKHGPLTGPITTNILSTKEGKLPAGKPPPLQEIINNNVSPRKPKEIDKIKDPRSGEYHGVFPLCKDKLQTPPICSNFGTDYAQSYAQYQSTIEPYLDKTGSTPSSKHQPSEIKPFMKHSEPYGDKSGCYETPFLYHPFEPFVSDIRRCRSQPESFYQQNTINNQHDVIKKNQLGLEHHSSLELIPKHHSMSGSLVTHHQTISNQISNNQQINGNYLQTGLYQQMSGSNQQINGPYQDGSHINLHQRRRISVSVITLPNGTTSISSNSSPDSFLSTDEEGKITPPESHKEPPSPLRLAAAFSTVTL